MCRSSRHVTPASAQTTTIADECATFLRGEYANALLDRAQEVPAWVWINSVAHGSPARLAALAAASPLSSQMRTDHQAWRIVVSAIAEAMLATAETTALCIDEIQELTLVPIEFALMSYPTGPRTTLRVIEEALARAVR